jgi:hypothetical protein
MRNQSFADEAEACRRQAALFVGRPEAAFLARLASSFEELAVGSGSRQPCTLGSNIPERSPVTSDGCRAGQ